MKLTKPLILALCATMTLAACGGGSSTTNTTVNATTKGQQLADLQAAYEAGALTDEEYQREREKILESE